MALSDLDLITVALFLPRLKNRVCKVVRTSQLSNINETTQILLEEMYLITKSYAFNQLRRDAMMLELKRAQVALVEVEKNTANRENRLLSRYLTNQKRTL